MAIETTHSEAAWLSDVSSSEMRRIVDTLYRTHHLIRDITDLDTLLETIMEESKLLVSAEACSLLLFDPQRQDLYFHVVLGEEGDKDALKNAVRLNLGEGIAGACAQDRVSINVQDATTDPRVYRAADDLSRFRTRSLLAVPMVDRDSLVGVIEVLNKRGGASFTEVDRRILEVFAVLAASVIVNARLIEENMRATRLAAIGQAISGLSHHAKNILAGLMSSVEIVDSGLADNDTAMLQTGWGVLKRSVDRISNVVEDMLTYSKARVPVRERCDLAEIVSDVRETYDTLLERRGIKFTTDLRDSSAVPIDSRAIYRAMMNLIGNAIDAAPDQGGRIRVVSYMQPPDTLHVEVNDNGPGVPKDLGESIFDPFFSTKGSKGTGLGLAVTKKIVDEHGGEIHVEAATDGGACFHFAIPIPRETGE